MFIDKVKIYKFLDTDSVVTSLSKKETMKWYYENYGEEVEEKDVVELDINKDGMWEPKKENHIVIYEEKNSKFGKEKEEYGETYIFLSFKQVLLEINLETRKEPFVIASTEY